MYTLPSISGACIAVRPSQRRSVSSDGPSRITSYSPADQALCGFWRLICFCRRHEFLAPPLDLARLNFFFEGERFGALFVGVAEDAEPVELRGFDEFAKLIEVFFGFTREADDERRAQGEVGNGATHLFDRFQEDVGVGATLHALQHVGGGVLQRDIDVIRDLRVIRDSLQQALGDLVGISVEETYPLQLFDLRQSFEEKRETVLHAQVFAVAGGVLPDEGDFFHALFREALGFRNHRFETARAEFAAQLRDDAERAGMIAAFGDLDVGRVFRRGQETRRVVVVEIVRQIGDGAIPLGARETSGFFAGRAFWAIGHAGLELLAGAGGVEDHERRVVIRTSGAEFRWRQGWPPVRRCRRPRRLQECFSGFRCDSALRGIRRRSASWRVLWPCGRPSPGWCRPTPAWPYR